MRAVLDTNSLLVSVGRKSPYRPILDALIEGRYTLLISNDILSEYVEIFERKTNALVAENIAQFLLQSPDVQLVDIFFKWAILHQDADDNKFLDCALNGRADLLVTDDRHFRSLQSVSFPSIQVFRTEDFLKVILS